MDLQSEAQHCGACYFACNDAQHCREGQCTCPDIEVQDLGTAVPPTITGTTAGAPLADDLRCAGPAPQRAFQFTVPPDGGGTYRFDSSGSSANTVIGLIDGNSCGELACRDDLSDESPSFSVILTAHQVVRVVVTSTQGEDSDFEIAIRRLYAPVASSCSPLDIGSTVPQTVTGSVAGMGDLARELCGLAPPGSTDVSFTFTPPHDGTYVFDKTGSSADVELAIYQESCHDPELFYGCSTEEDQRRVILELPGGVPFVVILDGFTGGAGDYSLTITERLPLPCPAVDLGSTVPQTVSDVTLDRASLDVDPGCTGNGVFMSVASYQFTAPADATYSFSTSSSPYDTWNGPGLVVRDGTCSGPELDCVEPNIYDRPSEVSRRLAAGQTVVVGVTCYSDLCRHSLSITMPAEPPCPEIDLGSTVPQSVTGASSGPSFVSSTCSMEGRDPIGPEKTFRFTAPSDDTYVFDTAGSDWNVLTVLDGEDSCSGAVLACNGDLPATRTELPLLAGQSVTVIVDSVFYISNGVALNIYRRDDVGSCASPHDLGSTVPQTVVSSRRVLYDEVDPSCNPGAGTSDEVYAFTAPTDGTYLFSTSSNTSWYTTLSLHDGGCSGTELRCAVSSSTAGGTARAWTIVALTAGQTVNAVVSYSRLRFDLPDDLPSLTIESASTSGTCSAPIELGSAVPLWVRGDATLNADSIPAPCNRAAGPHPDVVYHFTAPAAATYTFSAASSFFSPVVHVLEADCAGATLGCFSASSWIAEGSVTLAAGQVVTIAVEGRDDRSGTFTLDIF
ncbi:uncharacterized protein SOCE26_003550 [Sorangium cellulosum]|uniref:T9SS-like galactose binding domain-containing protein n=1 Tax=Sorangium cellulosum TaxID=56 RepID=A0A2L0EI51_SORCE|nr:uncharacterized protein SOCE26_003550 [Sorangium cellulosum]